MIRRRNYPPRIILCQGLSLPAAAPVGLWLLSRRRAAQPPASAMLHASVAATTVAASTAGRSEKFRRATC